MGMLAYASELGSVRLEPTYEGLKSQPPPRRTLGPSSLEPTYEGLKYVFDPVNGALYVEFGAYL